MTRAVHQWRAMVQWYIQNYISFHLFLNIYFLQRYIQPEVVKSCKPNTVYQRSCAPVACDTVYKTSYHPVPTSIANNCRLAPVLPICNIRVDASVRMDDETVTGLSYPGHPGFCREKPIKPCTRQLFATGPLQDLTTQKHDYVPKCTQRRALIIPKPMMHCTQLPLECETIHKLSFPNPCNAIPTVSCKPSICYQKPCLPVECDTTHKLSFQPVGIQAKEVFPWAQKARFTLPCSPVENETTYKLSYIGGSGGRYPIVVPKNNPCMITCDIGFDDRTIYNDSYLKNSVSCRPAPIRPMPTLCTPDCKMDPDTMYNLAYPGHYCVPKQKAVLPCPQPLPCGPMQDLTTQKHDFVNKPICRRQAIRPKNTIIKTSLPLDCTTTANASYMCPSHFSPSISCKPNVCYERPCCKQHFILFLSILYKLHLFLNVQYQWNATQRRNWASNRFAHRKRNALNGL